MIVVGFGIFLIGGPYGQPVQVIGDLLLPLGRGAIGLTQQGLGGGEAQLFAGFEQLLANRGLPIRIELGGAGLLDGRRSVLGGAGRVARIRFADVILSPVFVERVIEFGKME